MALSDQMIGDGLLGWFDLHGQTITVSGGQDNGGRFSAVLVVAPDAKINGEVVQDNRERTIAVFLSSSYPAKAMPGDFIIDESGQKWKLGKRTNNPVDQTTDFEVIKQTN